MAEPDFPPPPGISGGETLAVLSSSDLFVTWFDRTNALIDAVNPLEIYGLTAMAGGSNDGITLAIDNTTGIYSVGFSTPALIHGNTEFVDGITFSGNYVSFNGGTVDFSGSTLYGNVVRTFNGETGDVIFSANANLPGGANGQILVYNADGATWEAQNFFMGVTTDIILAGPSGGLLLGVTSGDAGNYYRKGTIQLGGPTAGILFRDDTRTNSHQRGIFVNYTDRDFRIEGGDTAGNLDTTNSPYVNISTLNRRMGLFGVTNPNAPIHYRARGFGQRELLIETANGNTFGLQIQNTLATVNMGEVDEFKFDISTNANNQGQFRVAGGTASSATSVIYANQSGDVVVGGSSRTSSGGSGSLNLASGELRVGGVTGESGYVLTSTGVSASWQEASGGGFEEVIINGQDFAGSTNPNSLVLSPGQNISLRGFSSGASVGVTVDSFIHTYAEGVPTLFGATNEGINISGTPGDIQVTAVSGTIDGVQTVNYQIQTLGGGPDGSDGITGLNAFFIESATSPSVTGPSFEGLRVTTTGAGITATFSPGVTTGTLDLEVTGVGGGGTGATGETGTTGATGNTGAGITSASLTAFASGGQTLSFETIDENGVTASITAGFITGFTGADGATGATGAIGATGATGNAGFRYVFSSSAPNSGEINYSSADGEFKVHFTTADGLNIQNYLNSITNGGDLAFAIASDGGAVATVKSSSVSSAASVRTIGGVTTDSGTFTAGEQIFFNFSPSGGGTGATGETGATGATGERGATGATGADSTVAGPTGSDGAPGATGTTGSDGLTGAAGFRYKTKTGSIPSGAILFAGAADPNFSVSITSDSGESLKPYLQTIATDRNDRIYVQSLDGSSHYSGRVTGTTDNTSNITFNVTDTTGTFYTTTDTDVYLYFIAGGTGEKGDTGADGPTGATGTTGATGAGGIQFRVDAYNNTNTIPGVGGMCYEIDQKTLRFDDEDFTGQSVAAQFFLGYPAVGDTINVSFTNLVSGASRGFVSGKIKTITNTGSLITVVLEDGDSGNFPPGQLSPVPAGAFAFVNFAKSGSQGAAGADGSAGSTGATGPSSPFRYTVRNVSTGPGVPTAGQVSVDTNGIGSGDHPNVPFVRFGSTDLDGKDIDTFIDDFCAVGDMIHLSSVDDGYYGFGNITILDSTNRRLYISGFTSDGSVSAGSTEVSVHISKRGSTGGVGDLQYYSIDDESPFQSTEANKISQIKIENDTTNNSFITMTRETNSAEDGNDQIKIKFSGSLGGSDGASAVGEYRIDEIVPTTSSYGSTAADHNNMQPGFTIPAPATSNAWWTTYTLSKAVSVPFSRSASQAQQWQSAGASSYFTSDSVTPNTSGSSSLDDRGFPAAIDVSDFTSSPFGSDTTGNVLLLEKGYMYKVSYEVTMAGGTAGVSNTTLQILACEGRDAQSNNAESSPSQGSPDGGGARSDEFGTQYTFVQTSGIPQTGRLADAGEGLNGALYQTGQRSELSRDYMQSFNYGVQTKSISGFIDLRQAIYDKGVVLALTSRSPNPARFLSARRMVEVVK